VRYGFVAEAPSVWWTADHVTTFRVYRATDQAPTSAAVVMVLVFADATSADAARGRDHLVPGYGPARWLQNVALVQSSRAALERWFSIQLARDLAPMVSPSSDGASDAGEAASVVNSEYVAVLDQLGTWPSVEAGCQGLVRHYLAAGLPSGATAEFTLEIRPSGSGAGARVLSGRLALDYPPYPQVAGTLAGRAFGSAAMEPVAVQLLLHDGQLELELGASDRDAVTVPLGCADTSLAFGASADTAIVLRLSDARLVDL
jgi:hypothetical protein